MLIAQPMFKRVLVALLVLVQSIAPAVFAQNPTPAPQQQSESLESLSSRIGCSHRAAAICSRRLGREDSLARFRQNHLRAQCG